MPRHESEFDRRIRRCAETTAAYRKHADSTRQRVEAAAELGIDEATMRERITEARRAGWLLPHE